MTSRRVRIEMFHLSGGLWPVSATYLTSKTYFEKWSYDRVLRIFAHCSFLWELFLLVFISDGFAFPYYSCHRKWPIPGEAYHALPYSIKTGWLVARLIAWQTFTESQRFKSLRNILSGPPRVSWLTYESTWWCWVLVTSLSGKLPQV